MVAYWNTDGVCVYANDAYRSWFGKGTDEMRGTSLIRLLGPVYELNLPYIMGVMGGKEQVFERAYLSPQGRLRHGIVTYTPDLLDGVLQGFWAHVVDATVVRERELALAGALRERDAALADATALRELLPICLACKSIRDDHGRWQALEQYLAERSPVRFTHGICPTCVENSVGGLLAVEQATDRTGGPT